MDLNPFDLVKAAMQRISGNKPPQSTPAPFISPIASPQIQSPGMQYYQAMQQARQNQQPVQDTSQPKTLDYNQFVANAFNHNDPTPSQAPRQNAVQQAISQLINPNRSQQPQARAEGFPQGATDYEKQAAEIFNKYGIPPQIGLGIWAEEGRGKTINPNNPYDIGAYDSNPQNAKAYGFKNPLEGTEAAAQMLSGQKYVDSNKAKIFQQALEQYKQSGDAVSYLQAIAPTYASDKNYVKKIMQTPEFQRWSYNQ